MTITWDHERLYVSRCGAVSKLSSFGIRNVRLEVVAIGDCSICASSCYRPGDTWNYTKSTGCWQGEDHNETYHFHIVREIEK